MADIDLQQQRFALPSGYSPAHAGQFATTVKKHGATSLLQHIPHGQVGPFIEAINTRRGAPAARLTGARRAPDRSP